MENNTTNTIMYYTSYDGEVFESQDEAQYRNDLFDSILEILFPNYPESPITFYTTRADPIPFLDEIENNIFQINWSAFLTAYNNASYLKLDSELNPTTDEEELPVNEDENEDEDEEEEENFTPSVLEEEESETVSELTFEDMLQELDLYPFPITPGIYRRDIITGQWIEFKNDIQTYLDNIWDGFKNSDIVNAIDSSIESFEIEEETDTTEEENFNTETDIDVNES